MQNSWNQDVTVKSKSGIKGVYFRDNKWKATICINKKRTALGTFDTPEEAKQAYWRAAATNFGEYARS